MTNSQKGKQIMSEEQTEDKVIEIVRRKESKSSIDVTELEEISNKINSHKPSLSISDITDVENYGVHSMGIHINLVAPVSIEKEVINKNEERCKETSIEFLNNVIIPCCKSVADFISSHPEYDVNTQVITSGTSDLVSFAMNDKLKQLADKLANSL